MELGFGLAQQLQTKLVITPELRQSITILQYPTLDLICFLRDKADENPLIELEEPEELQWNNNILKNRTQHVWDDEETKEFTSFNEDYVNPIDYYASSEGTLQDYLKEQIGYLNLTPVMKQLMLFLIGNVNDQGYLDVEFEMLPSTLQLSKEDWDLGIDILHQLEPTGVGARSLEECLLLQIRLLEGQDELCETVIRHHLTDIATKRYQKIATKLKVKAEEIQQIADFIGTLNPKPGMYFHSHDSKYIIPDVFVEKLPNGKVSIQINDRVLPRIHMNKEYMNLIEQNNEAKQYLEERVQQLQWIERSLEQRQSTILKVTKAIVKAQEDFFVHGKNVVKSLTLRDIAQQINVHESTVSRATNQKYIQTPQGVYELKFFFSNRLSSNLDDQTSSFQVKQWIKTLLEQEDKGKPLSDQKIVQELNEQGITVARRTVAKYREELGILSSSQRKRYKK